MAVISFVDGFMISRDTDSERYHRDISIAHIFGGFGGFSASSELIYNHTRQYVRFALGWFPLFHL